MKRGIRGNVIKRMNANRQKLTNVKEREEREAEAIRMLNQKQKEQKA